MKKLVRWKILKTRTAFRNLWWDIADETVRLPDGSVTHFFVNRSLGGVVIFPLTAEGEVLLVRQYKHGARRVLFELPVGRREINDASPAAAARRELLEETGYRPGRFRLIGKFELFPTSSTGKFWLYLAADCRRVSDPQNTPKETTEVVRLPLARLLRFVHTGKVPSLAQAGAIYAALDFLKRSRAGGRSS